MLVGAIINGAVDHFRFSTLYAMGWVGVYMLCSMIHDLCCCCTDARAAERTAQDEQAVSSHVSITSSSGEEDAHASGVRLHVADEVPEHSL